MDNNTKNHVIILSEKLNAITSDYLIENVDNMEKCITTHISFIMSVYLSSMFSVLQSIKVALPEYNKDIDELIDFIITTFIHNEILKGDIRLSKTESGSTH